MNKEQMNLAIAAHLGYVECNQWNVFIAGAMKMKADCGHDKCYPEGMCTDYAGNLNAMAEAEKLLDDPKYNAFASSRPQDHAPHRYLAALAEICGLKAVEELVLSCDAMDRGKLNFRPGPYPTPIKLPPSAIVLGHSIPAYGYELCLIRATAEQRAEAWLKTVGGWVKEKV